MKASPLEPHCPPDPKVTFLCWLVCPLYTLIFFSILLVFHPLLIVARTISHTLFLNTVTALNALVLKNLEVTAGAQFSIRGQKSFPSDRPLLVVSNHQGTYDVCLLTTFFSKHKPRFISKRELARWIPSVSYSVRHNGSALIDRSDKRQALEEIRRVGRETERENGVICLFPEGTRARNGAIKPFKGAGFAALLEEMPRALIVPVSIARSWELLRYRLLPTPTRVRVSLFIHEPIEPAGRSAKELLSEIESLVRSTVEELQSQSAAG